MLLKKITICFLALVCCIWVKSVSFGESAEALQMEKQEYGQELNRIKSLRKSFKPGPINDINEYKKSADQIQDKWKKKNKEYYARLMWELCKPLSSGRFNNERQYDVARRYALSALAEPNEIPLEIELELIGHVMTDMITPRSPKGQDWVQRRMKDVEVRLHAWKRLTDTVDPNWDPNDMPFINVPLPQGVEGISGMAPNNIKNLKLRAEYEAAIEKNKQKAKRYSEQYGLRKWLKRFPPKAERYIVRAYSKPPFNVEELKRYLDNYIVDEKTKTRILNAVTKDMQNKSQKIPKEPDK